MSYQGWANYDTWKAITEISNDESSYLRWSIISVSMNDRELLAEIRRQLGAKVNASEILEAIREWSNGAALCTN